MFLLRVGRRRTAWESHEVDTILKNEFFSCGRYELNVSVYFIDESDVTRTVAEHAATTDCDPRGFPNVDLEAGRPTLETPGDSRFEFTKTVHRELTFDSEAELREFIATAVLPTIDRRKHAVSKQQVRDYARAREAAGDVEWLAFLSARTGKWP